MHELTGSFLVCLILAVFILHCSVVGFALDTALKPWRLIECLQSNISMQLFFVCTSGFVINIAALFLVSITGHFDKYVVFLTGITFICISFAVIIYQQSPREILSNARRTIYSHKFDCLAVLFLFIIVLLVALSRVPGHWDDTMYHLPLARFYVQHRGIVLNEYLRFPLVPQNMQLLFGLGLMLGGDTAAEAMATIPIFIISLGLIGCGVWLLGSTLPGFLSTLVVFYFPGIRETLGFAYIDSGLALFSWGAILAVALWTTASARSGRALIIAGMLAGGAAGTKITGGVLALLLGLYVLLMRRDWGAVLTYGVTTLAFGSWWYVRSAIISGDPIHPMGGNIFGYYLWNAGDLLYQQQVQGSYEVEKNVLSLWPVLHHIAALLWVLAFLSGKYVRQNTGLQAIYSAYCGYFLFWIIATRVERYLAPAFAAASFLAVYFLYRAALGRLLGILMSWKEWLSSPQLPAALSLLLLVPAAAYLHIRSRYAMADWSETLQRRVGYTLFEQANKLSPVFGDRLVQVGFENDVYFFDGTVIGDWFGVARYSTMMRCSVDFAHSADFCQMIPPVELVKLMNVFNSRMLVVNTNRVTIDIVSYERYFELSKQTDDGVLLTLR
jgi:hypothetical protein